MNKMLKICHFSTISRGKRHIKHLRGEIWFKSPQKWPKNRKNVAALVCWRQFRATRCRHEVNSLRSARTAPSAGLHGTLQPTLPGGSSSCGINTSGRETMRRKEKKKKAYSLISTPVRPVLGKVLRLRTSQDQISEIWRDGQQADQVSPKIDYKTVRKSAKPGWAEETRLKVTPKKR